MIVLHGHTEQVRWAAVHGQMYVQVDAERGNRAGGDPPVLKRAYTIWREF
jgi:hypothetical protein